jgi:tetratricopeptide (TPR) repeat protein
MWPLFLTLLLSAAAETPKHPSIDDRLLEIVDEFYDLRFEQALESARKLEKDFPGHPAGPFYESMAHYQRYLTEDPPSKETFKLFVEVNKRALAACETYRAKDPATAERFLGAAHGFYSRALFADKDMTSAIRHARKAVDHINKALELNPADDEAKLGVGMYKYFLSRVPPLARPFAAMMMGTRGDRELGLELVKRAANGKGPGRIEAQTVLAAIYGSRHEKRYGEAEEIFVALMKRYPGNPLYRLRAVIMAMRRADFDRARLLADPDGDWISKLHPSLREKARFEAKRRYDEAAELRDGRRKEPEKFKWPLPGLPNQ